MKKFKYLSIVTATMLLFSACGSSSKKDNSQGGGQTQMSLIRPKRYSQDW